MNWWHSLVSGGMERRKLTVKSLSSDNPYKVILMCRCHVIIGPFEISYTSSIYELISSVEMSPRMLEFLHQIITSHRHSCLMGHKTNHARTQVLCDYIHTSVVNNIPIIRNKKTEEPGN